MRDSQIVSPHFMRANESHQLPKGQQRVNKRVNCSHGDLADGGSLLTFEESDVGLLISSEGENAMKYKIVLCSLLLMVAFADLAVARNSNNSDAEPAGPSTRKSLISLKKLGYQNLRDASQWSRLTHGRALALSLRKKKAHSFQDPDGCLECGDMFPGDGNVDGMVIEGAYLDKTGGVGGGGGGGCNWSCCFKICMKSAMGPNDNICLTNCTGCGLTGSPWSCAICAACGTVGFAAVEFCGLHCCVNPGC